jgi:hypothetical protein
VPDCTTADRLIRRLNAAALGQTLSTVVPRLASRPGHQTPVAVDATALASGAISAFLVQRAKDRGEGFTWRHWRKWTMVVDIDQRVLLSQTARHGPTHDCATWRPLVSAAHERIPIGVALLEAEFDSERNHQHSRQPLHTQSGIPAKRAGAEWRMQGVRAQMRQECPVPFDGRCAPFESLIAAVKRTPLVPGPLPADAMPASITAGDCLQPLAGDPKRSVSRGPACPPRATPSACSAATNRWVLRA